MTVQKREKKWGEGLTVLREARKDELELKLKRKRKRAHAKMF